MLLNKLQFPLGSMPSWLKSNVILLNVMGSEAYACNTDHSDKDIYGVCIPPKHYLYADKKIIGYDQLEKFDQWQLHGFEQDRVKYDFSIYNIARYFHLLEDNNPNMLDSIFVSQRCVLFSSAIGQRIREHRRIFLSKKCYHKMKAYALSQLHKLDRKPEGKRVAIVEKYGYDVKYASHAVRIVSQCEQILKEHDLDLEKEKETLKSIRRGDWTLDQVKQWFYDRDRQIEKIYYESTLKEKPDHDAVRELLLECINMHHGNIVEPSNNKILDTFKQVRDLINGI